MYSDSVQRNEVIIHDGRYVKSIHSTDSMTHSVHEPADKGHVSQIKSFICRQNLEKLKPTGDDRKHWNVRFVTARCIIGFGCGYL